jgi:hypothetical protein
MISEISSLEIITFAALTLPFALSTSARDKSDLNEP